MSVITDRPALSNVRLPLATPTIVGALDVADQAPVDTDVG